SASAPSERCLHQVAAPYLVEASESLRRNLETLSRSLTADCRWPTSPILQHPLRGVAGQLRAVPQVQFGPNAVAVSLDRLDAQVQPLGDLRRLHALADQPEDLQLAVSQGVYWRARGLLAPRADGPLQQSLGHRLAQPDLTRQDPPHGLDNPVRGLVL